MVSLVRSIKIFLSSPGDLASERETISDVCKKVSIDHGESKGFSIELVRWETHTFSSRGASAQDVISLQVGQDYDIFLGMMGSRFGTPTRKFESGTEEEFADALTRNKATGKPEMMFFFRKERRSPDELDIGQYLKVKNFRASVEAEGILHFTFDDQMFFWRELYSQLLMVINRILDGPDSIGLPGVQRSLENVFDPLLEWNSLLSTDSEVNASVLMGLAIKSMGRVSADLNSLSKCTLGLTRTINKETRHITNRGPVNPPIRLAKSFGNVESAISNSNRQYLEIAPRFHANLKESAEYAVRSISILTERGDMEGETKRQLAGNLSQFVTSLVLLSGSMLVGLDELKGSFEPGTVLSVETKKFTAIMKDLKRVIDNGATEFAALENILKPESH